MIKIFIVENIPSLNKGEMAILDGMLESFKTLGEVRVYMLSGRSEIDAPRYTSKVNVIDVNSSFPYNGGLDVSAPKKILASVLVMIQHTAFILSYKILGENTKIIFRSDIWHRYLNSDIIITGHNGMFGIGGSLGIPLFYPLYISAFAKILGRPVILYAGSIPRLSRFKSINILLKFALNNMDFVTLRERISYNNFLAIGANAKNVVVTADLAFLVSPSESKCIKEIMLEEGINNCSNLLIGMTVTREIASKSNMELDLDSRYYNHLTIMSKFIDNITTNYNATIVFIPHCIGFGENLDDRIVANDIYERCENKYKITQIVNEYDAQELKGLIGNLDFFIGERIHSVINAMSMKVPSICISFSNDGRLDMIRMIGQDDAICHVEDLDADKLIIKFYDMWLRKETIQKDLTERIGEIQNISRSNGELLKSIYTNKKR